MSKWEQLVGRYREADIPAPALRAVTLAQWINESGHGTSQLALLHNNFSGLKWRDEMAPYATKIRYGAHDGVDDYCAFASVDDFIAGYWAFISRSVYKGWEAFQGDPRGFVSFLKERGFAGSKTYVDDVMRGLGEAINLLGDQASAVEEDRPNRESFGDTTILGWDAELTPDFITVPSAAHAFHGARPQGLEGMIVHYDAGRDRPAQGNDDPEWGARGTLEWGEERGFAFLTVSRTGKIYVPSNFSWDKWGHHAGDSICPETKRPSVSRFYVGVEVNCPGWLYPTSDANAFVPWFNTVMETAYTKAGKAYQKTVLDGKGRATVRNAKGVIYERKELRHVPVADGNIRPGAYVPYTDEQFRALAILALYLKRKFKTFRFDRVFGHDEVSPLRKVDPGGSLGHSGKGGGIGPAMTMAQFRAELYKLWGSQPVA